MNLSTGELAPPGQAGVILTAGHAARRVPIGAIQGGPDIADRPVDDIHGNQHRTASCVAQKNVCYAAHRCRPPRSAATTASRCG
ncbi:hypothetical protein [Burkholderia sp. BCC0322]|uniref:hypothetical protein n=1 Tax=unclassified Burkholderia TaxID=2613784 RepID=UPI00158EB07A|nr:hypothetical protein [Burkholderia sp. BCC0322]